MREILLSEYQYELPTERIALYPLPQRDQSKLLVYEQGEIRHASFKDIGTFLPKNASLFFNDTRVIPARLIFKKVSGAEIEIFILHPLEPSTQVHQAMQAAATATWQCTIGNLKRWTEGLVLTYAFSDGELKAFLVNREKGIVRFSWNPVELTFAEVIKESGFTPLPPYLKRKAESDDRIRYQTVYSQADGAVAAPTAGLHFTDDGLAKLKNYGIVSQFLTLHVSAGTFLPVKVENALDHPMHSEQVQVSRGAIESLLQNRKVVAVGTTSMRTLESLYWYGAKLWQDKKASFTIHKMDAYELAVTATKNQALESILEKMESEHLDSIAGETSIYIVPGYNFKMVEGLITNFHQPSSTLMLLVAAFIGEDWKKVYQQALQNGYRFLSYGDSSLLLP